MVVSGPTITLSNGVQIPAVGLGTWLSSPEEAKSAVLSAVRAGYRLIDTAALYDNEEAIGGAIHELIAEGVVKREELFITTKVFSQNLAPTKIEAAIRGSLQRLNLEYLDLFLAHNPAAFEDDGVTPSNDVSVEDIWSGFDEVYKLKLTRAVGVSNWNNEQISRVLRLGKTPVHNSQVELHLYFGQQEHVEFCKRNNIVVTSYGTLGSPGRFAFNHGSIKWDEAPSELEDKNVLALAKKYNKTPAQILLRYALDRGVAIIPKSIKAHRIVENFQLFDFKLSQNEVAVLETAKHNKRLFLHEYMIGHKEDAFVNSR